MSLILKEESSRKQACEESQFASASPLIVRLSKALVADVLAIVCFKWRAIPLLLQAYLVPNGIALKIPFD